MHNQYNLEMINKKRIEFRRSKKWKQLEKIYKWREERNKGNVLFGNLLNNYIKLRERVVDTEVLKIIDEDIRSISIQCREEFNSHVTGWCNMHVVNLKPAESLKIFRKWFPLSNSLRKLLRFDILKKGVVHPILIVQETREIIDGVSRWEIAKELGDIRIKCMNVSLNGLSELNKLRYTIELWLSSNVAGRQQTNRPISVSLNKYFNLLNSDPSHPWSKQTNGRPTELELYLISEYKKKGIYEMDLNDRLLFNLFGLEDYIKYENL